VDGVCFVGALPVPTIGREGMISLVLLTIVPTID
jgi:hypothetical protein